MANGVMSQQRAWSTNVHIEILEKTWVAREVRHDKDTSQNGQLFSNVSVAYSSTCHYSLMKVAVWYWNVGEQLTILATVYESSSSYWNPAGRLAAGGSLVQYTPPFAVTSCHLPFAIYHLPFGQPFWNELYPDMSSTCLIMLNNQFEVTGSRK